MQKIGDDILLFLYPLTKQYILYISFRMDRQKKVMEIKKKNNYKRRNNV